MPQRVILIHSPHSGRSSKLPDAIKHLEQAGLEVVKSISIADLDDLPAQGISWKESGGEETNQSEEDIPPVRVVAMFPHSDE